MNNPRPLKKLEQLQRRRREWTKRPGVVVVMTGFCLIAVFAFVALSVDAGRMVLTETKMQNACDAASLAAAQEITAAVYAAGQGQGPADIDANSIAVEEARDMAEQVAAANGVYIDKEADVRFGKRVFDAATHTWPIHWDEDPYNVVQVTARRTQTDVSLPDGQLPLAFGWSVGRDKVPLQTSATAFVEARDLVIVLDVSASMNDDSSLISDLPIAEVEGLLDGMWNALRSADPTWPSTSTSKFPPSGFGLVNSAEGTYLSSSDTLTIRNALGLNENVSGYRRYPFPQSGRYSNGDPKPKPSNSTSDSLWNGYISYVKGLSGPYNKKYGYRTLMSYLQEQRFDPSQSEDLWRTPHYPYEAVKKGTTLFLDFLEELDFGDEVGWVAYGQWAVQQMGHADGEVNIDISDNPITDDYDTINTMQLRHQAGEYAGWTAMGDGILKAKELLVGTGGDDDGYTRYGARPTMLVMTDGQTNQKPAGWTLPAGFNWGEWTDYDGDGDADYTASNSDKKYAFYEAVQAASRGITIHTLAVGSGADRDLMRAIAFVGGGIFIDVPGGGTADMEEDLLEAFGQIASKVPPAKLVYELSAEEN
jgi:Flp pilus assembly protein TadG